MRECQYSCNHDLTGCLHPAPFVKGDLIANVSVAVLLAKLVSLDLLLHHLSIACLFLKQSACASGT